MRCRETLLIAAQCRHRIDSRGTAHWQARGAKDASARTPAVKEEENELLPKAKALDIDFIALGQLMLDRKAALEKGGIPDDAGHAMVAKAKGKGDSPAVKARNTTSPLRKTPAKTGTGRTVKSVRARASR